MPANKISSNLPFAGVRVLVGRARGQAKILSTLLSDFGATVFEIPFIEIRAPRSWRELDRSIRNLRSYDWIILTSVNGVQALFSRLEKLGMMNGEFRNSKVAAIGPATKRAVEKRGVRVAVTPPEYVAEAVVESLRHEVSGKRILLVRAKVARDLIPLELQKAGAKVDVVAAYETVLPAGSRAKLRELLRDPARRPHVVTFTSSSTVRNFTKLAQGLSLNGIRFASIGPVTSATMRELGLFPHAEAREYTMAGLVGAIAELNLSV
jgi:uroporphyrinogen-III synthase